MRFQPSPIRDGRSDVYELTAGWHVPGFWNITYQYNRTWTGVTEWRKALAMPIINPAAPLQMSPVPTNEPQANIIFCYVEPKWYCPNAGRGNTTSITGSGITLVPILYSYGMNVEGIDDATAWPQDVDANVQQLAPQAYDSPSATPAQQAASFHGFKISQVRRPSEKLEFTDALGAEVNESVQPLTASNYDAVHESNQTTPKGITRDVAWRHGGYANVCFFDGHVEEGCEKMRSTCWDHHFHLPVGNDRLWKVLH